MRRQGSGMKYSKLLVIVIGAIGLWVSSRFTWLTVHTFDDKAGDAVTALVGAAWAPELAPVGLAIIAGVFATLILGRWGRRIVGALIALLAVGASWTPMRLLSTGKDSLDTQRVLDLLTSGAATQRANAPVTISDWAQVDTVDMHYWAPALALVACALALFGGVLLIRQPGEAKKKTSAYETPEVRRQRLKENLKAEPESGRVLWDALDAGVDFTDDEEIPESVKSSDSVRTPKPEN